MVTRFEMEQQATQEMIVEALEEISGSLTHLAYVAVEYGIHEGFLSGSDRRERPEDPITLEGGHQV